MKNRSERLRMLYEVLNKMKVIFLISQYHEYLKNSKESAFHTMYRGMTRYEFILAVYIELSSHKPHFKFRFQYSYITKSHPVVKKRTQHHHFPPF